MRHAGPITSPIRSQRHAGCARLDRTDSAQSLAEHRSASARSCGARRKHATLPRSFIDTGVDPSAHTATVLRPQLIAPGRGCEVPRLHGVACHHRFFGGDGAAVMLARHLLALGLATPTDWATANREPVALITATLARFIDNHGRAAIARRFELSTVLSADLENGEVDGSNHLRQLDADAADGHPLFLSVHPSSAGVLVLEPTLTRLERADPRLPGAFFHTVIGALNQYVRVYDYRDGLERVEMLREWYAEEDAEGYELPNVADCVPASLAAPPLADAGVAALVAELPRGEARDWMEAALDLARRSRAGGRMPRSHALDEAQREGDFGPPLPALLALFHRHDAIEGCFDEESEHMYEVTPFPTAVIPLDATRRRTVHRAFRALAACCDTLSAASHLFDRLPGNEEHTFDPEPTCNRR